MSEIIPNENAPVGSPERRAWQISENQRARAIVDVLPMTAPSTPRAQELKS